MRLRSSSSSRSRVYFSVSGLSSQVGSYDPHNIHRYLDNTCFHVNILAPVSLLGELMSIWGLNGSSDSVGDADPCKLLPQLGYRFSAR